MNSDSQNPIFIHSLFRTGSTYLFNVFRRSKSNYSCYQEPLNEQLNHLLDNPEKIINLHHDLAHFLRHPKLEKPYFYEFYIIANNIKDTFKKSFSYDSFFPVESNENLEIILYFKKLNKYSNGRPIFQICRSLGRIKTLKSAMQGSHIYLWRNPWDQWWSCKLGFDSNHLLILNSKNPPNFLKVLKQENQVPEFHSDNIFEETTFFSKPWLNSEQSYILLYALWCYGILEAEPQCDISINIDMLSTSQLYRDDITDRLSNIGLNDLDFSDCHIPIGVYSSDDIIFFEKCENYVHELLITYGYSAHQVNLIKEIREANLVRPSEPADVNLALSRDLKRARNLVNNFQTELGYLYRTLSDSDQTVTIKNQESVLKDQKAMIKSQEALIKEQEAMLKEQEVLIDSHEASLEKYKELDDKYQQLTKEIEIIHQSFLWRMTSTIQLIFQNFRNK